jgi:hypothetical protein
MDWYEAEDLVKEFYSDNGFIGLRGCNPFLSDRLFVLTEAERYEDIYDINMSRTDTNDPKFKTFVQNYIDSKLSWKS